MGCGDARRPLQRLALALARAGPAFALGCLETLRDGLRLRKVVGRGAPVEQASGNSPDGERHSHLHSHAQEAVFHCGGADPLRKCEARRGIVQGLNFP